MTLQGAPAASDRHHALDMIRGIAAAGVATYHFLAWNADTHIQSMGTFSVYLFFTLSALTMMMVYGDRFAGSITVAEVQSFYRNRVARLLPLLATVAFASFLVAGPTLGNAARATLTATGIFSLHMPGFLSNSIGAWSLGIEGIFYIVFPVAALLAAAASLRNLIWVATILTLAQQVLLYLLQPIAEETFFHYYTAPLTFAPFFAVGFVIHRLGGERKVSMLPMALTLLVAVMSFSALVEAPLFRSQGLYVALSIMVALVVLCSYRSAVPAALEGTASFLGNISYSLYLTHWIADRIAKITATRLTLPVEVQFTIYAAGSTILAFIVYQWLERPARNLLRGRKVRKPDLKVRSLS